jgi:Helicase associated domain
MLSARSPQAKRDLDAWYHRLRDLWRYKEEYGHCRVPRSHTDTQLANWVRRQRDRNKSPYPLSPDQMDALNQIGFVWNPKCKELQSSHTASAAQTPSSQLNLLALACTAPGSHSSSGETLARREIDYAHGEPSSRKRSAQSDRFIALSGLVRLEPMPREIAAAQKRYAVVSGSSTTCSFRYPNMCLCLIDRQRSKVTWMFGISTCVSCGSTSKNMVIAA